MDTPHLNAPQRPVSAASSEYSFYFDPASPTASSRTSSVESFKKTFVPSQTLLNVLEAKGLLADADGRVKFAEKSRLDPKHWGIWQKCFATVIVCFLEFWMTLISNTGTALTETAAEQWHINVTAATASIVTTYLLGQALGGLIFPPIAETFGGRFIWIGTVVGYTICNIIMAAWPNHAVVIVFRFISGMLSSIPATVAVGTLENMWDTKARIFVIRLWIANAVLGLAMAVPLTVYVTESYLQWPFVFGLGAIVTFPFIFLCWFMKESRPERILQEEVAKIVKRYRCPELHADAKTLPSFREFVQDQLLLPLRLFFHEKLVWTVSIMGAFVYGLVYLFSEAFTIVFEDGYSLGPHQASWVTAAFAVAIPFAFLNCIVDVHRVNKAQNKGKEVTPEQKLFGFFVAAPLLAIGLLVFAATIPPLSHVTPWVPVVALVAIGYSVIEFDMVLSGYLTDAYGPRASSANSPMSFLRCILSGIFPLFSKLMFEEMGTNAPNNAVFLLAGFAVIFCGVALWFGSKSKDIRKKSVYTDKTNLSPLNSRESLIEEKTRAEMQTQRVTDVFGYRGAPAEV